MPTVFTLEGDGGDLGRHKGKQCKRVRNPRTGCSMTSCKGKNGRWRFQKGSKECPRR